MVLVVTADVVLAVPVLLSFSLLLHRRLRPPHPPHPHLHRHRPLPLLLALHLLLLLHFLPSLISLFRPLPCPLLLLPVYLASHGLLALLTVSTLIFHLHAAINTHILPSLTSPSSPSPTPSPASSLSPSPTTSPLRSPSSSLSSFPWSSSASPSDATRTFSITITTVDGETSSSPTSSPSAATAVVSQHGQRTDGVARVVGQGPVDVGVRYHLHRWWGQWKGPGVLITAAVSISALFLVMLDPSDLPTTCSPHPPLLLTLTACTVLYLLTLACLTLPSTSFPSDVYGRKRELLTLLAFPLPLYLASLAYLTADWSPYAVLLHHLALASTSLTLTLVPLRYSSTPSLCPTHPHPSSLSSSSSSPVDLSSVLLSPPAPLLAHLRSALLLPELSLLHSLAAYHRLFSPSPAFHLPLRNLHLDRIVKHHKRKRRKSSIAPSTPSPSSSKAQHLQRTLTQAQILFQRYLTEESPLYIALPRSLVSTVRQALLRLTAEATGAADLPAPADVGGPRVAVGGRLVLEKRERKDVVQCLMELGEVWTEVEREVTELLGGGWVRRWVEQEMAKGEGERGMSSVRGWTQGQGASVSPSSKSASSVEQWSSPGASPAFSAAPPPSAEADVLALSPSTGSLVLSLPVVVRGTLAHLQAMHQSQQRRPSPQVAVVSAAWVGRVQGGSSWMRHTRSRSISCSSETADARTTPIHLPTRRASLGHTPS